jgi:hypothetical protein
MKWGNGDQYEWTLGGELVNKNLLCAHLGKNGVMFMLLQHEHVSKWGFDPMHGFTTHLPKWQKRFGL